MHTADSGSLASGTDGRQSAFQSLVRDKQVLAHLTSWTDAAVERLVKAGFERRGFPGPARHTSQFVVSLERFLCDPATDMEMSLCLRLSVLRTDQRMGLARVAVSLVESGAQGDRLLVASAELAASSLWPEPMSGQTPANGLVDALLTGWQTCSHEVLHRLDALAAAAESHLSR